MNHAQYSEVTEDLRALFVERLSVRARTFPRAVRKAGRLLPPAARGAADTLIAAEARLAHPKLAARTDPGQITEAADIVRAALTRHRPGARAGRQRSLLIAEIGFRGLVVLVAGLAILQVQPPV